MAYTTLNKMVQFFINNLVILATKNSESLPENAAGWRP